MGMSEIGVTKTDYALNSGFGLNADTIRYISSVKGETEALLNFRLKALEFFFKSTLPQWVPETLNAINFQNLQYYIAEGQRAKKTWEEVPEAVKETFERLGIPEKERKFLAGVEAQFDSEFAYSKMHQQLQDQGVIFTDSREGLSRYYDIFERGGCCR